MKLASKILFICVSALLTLGMIMLFSASFIQKGAYYLKLQLMWGGIGLVACVLAASLDYRHLKKISIALFVITVLMLILVAIPGIGKLAGGARRWFEFNLGGSRKFSFQPSELGKIVILIALAHYGEWHQRQMKGFVRGIVIPGLMVGLVAGLILAGRDYGTTMLVATASAGVILLSGARWSMIIPLGLAIVTLLGFAIWQNPVRKARVIAWLNPEQTAAKVGYQADQAKIAIGAGGWTGRGLGDSRQKHGFVPEHHTDFILAVIAEELGLAATLSVVAVFITLIICGAIISWKASDPFGMLLAAGITFMIGLQAFINIGVVTSVLPNKGLPLPFISYGGSNLLMMLASVGVLLSVAWHAGESTETHDEIPVSDAVPSTM